MQGKSEMIDGENVRPPDFLQRSLGSLGMVATPAGATCTGHDGAWAARMQVYADVRTAGRSGSSPPAPRKDT